MPKKKDLTGKRFGRLTVINQNIELSKEKKVVVWDCICDCGKCKSVRSDCLLSGKTQSCGCLRNEKVRDALKSDLKGQRFGKLLVLEEVPIDVNSTKTKRVRWLCQCDCGNIIITDSNNLKSGDTKSCGCYNKNRIRETLLKDLRGKRFGKLTVITLDEIEMQHKKQQVNYDSRAYWLCRCDCGNYKTVSSDSLTQGYTTSCGCIHSQGEVFIENYLKDNDINYISQYKFENLKGIKGGLLRFDFAVFYKEKLYCLIEYQGQQHYEPVDFFGGQEAFETQKQNDLLKIKYCEENNLKLITLSYKDEMNFDFLKEIINETKKIY